MPWGRSNAAAKPATIVSTEYTPPVITPAVIDWQRLVTVDFETYYDSDYTLRKLSTSEYIRDPRFKAQCVGIKIGNKPTKVYPHNKVKEALQSIPWATHSLLAHHAQFDGLILFEHFRVSPVKIYDTLSMARALFSNDIGAGLDEVSQFLGGPGKVHADALEETFGVRDWSPALFKRVTPYCAGDVDETFRIFKEMLPRFPAEEIDMIDYVCRMFTEPVLQVDRPRVEKELEREIEEKKKIMLSFVADADEAGIKLSKSEIAALGTEETTPITERVSAKLTGAPSQEMIDVRRVKKLIGSSEGFANLLRKEGIDPPRKVSPAYFKHRDESKKYTYAFSKTDMAFVELQEHSSARVRALVEARISVKSTTNETRAGRFLTASENGACLPVYLKYSAAHTHRLGGGNKMNMQNLKRGGELRKAILAPKGYELAVVDSGQIEARMNAWLWGQDDLLDDFRLSDIFTNEQDKLPKEKRKMATGMHRDPYCKFGDAIYGREITKKDEEERFIGKTCILGLGYQMSAPRLQKTLALGIGGPQVFLSEEECARIVSTYRKKYYRIKTGWKVCQSIIEQMAAGVSGSYKCIAWDKETIYLPNGMTMHYPELHDKRIADMVAAQLTGEEPEYDTDMPNFVYTRKGVETKVYGGLLCENIVQALARIVVLGQCLTVAPKYRWVMSTHDEGVFLTKKGQAKKALDYALEAFKQPPAWAPDLPLNAEGSVDVFYSK